MNGADKGQQQGSLRPIQQAYFCYRVSKLAVMLWIILQTLRFMIAKDIRAMI